MFAAIHIPDFHLQAQLRLRRELRDNRPGGRAVALLDEDGKIIQRNSAAAGVLVDLGMSATHAQARCDSIELLYRNADDEALAQSDLLDCAEHFSPDFESTGEGVATIDLFSNPAKKNQRLGREIVDWLRGARLDARVGIAANPDLALLAAKLAEPVVAVRGSREEIRKFLAPLPVEALVERREFLEVLSLWGVRTLGDFTMLPRSEITERLGPEAGELWDHASGTRRRLLRLVRPSIDYSQKVELDFEVDSLEPCLFLIQRALEVIGTRLSANYLVAERIELILDYRDGSAYQREFRIPDPCRDEQLLFRILHTHLEDFEARAPIRGLKLEATATKPHGHQFKLFESSIRDPNRFGETLARLEALLGSENVGAPEVLPASKPDTFRQSAFDPENAVAAAATELENPDTIPNAPISGLVLRRFRPPRPVLLAAERDGPYERPVEITNGALRGPVRAARGPWLNSGDWWDRFAWARQEWDVELTDGNLYRLVREDERWKLDGVYG
ncbi:MAG: protein ImuB [Verrucomicrobiales bacterium]|jgi:protein ImuB